MKKKLFYFLALIILIFSGVYFWRYHTTACYCNIIPKGAKAIVRIDLRKIEQQYLHDYISHPWSYIRSRKTTFPDSIIHQEDPVRLTDIFDFPRIMTISALDDYRTKWISNAVKVKDKDQIYAYLNDKGFVEVGDKPGLIYSHGIMHIHFAGDEAVLLLGSWDEKGITNLFARENNAWLDVHHPLLEKLTASESLVTYVDDEEQILEIKIQEGAVLVDGRYDVPFLLPSAGLLQDADGSTISARLDVNAARDFIPAAKKDEFSNFTKVDLDTLMNYWNGDIQVDLKGQRSVIDTIITYEYDDDFNKIAINKTEKKLHPDFILQVGIDSSGWDYLVEKKAIATQEEDQILAILPLVRTFANLEGDQIVLATDDSYNISTELSDKKLDIFLDLEKVDLSGSQLTLLNKFSVITGHVDNDDQISIKAITRNNGNALVALLSGK